MIPSTTSSTWLVSLVSDNTGIALRLLTTAVRYWATYPGEVYDVIFPQNRGFPSAILTALTTLLNGTAKIQSGRVLFLTRG
jgi:hypothetical protein